MSHTLGAVHPRARDVSIVTNLPLSSPLRCPMRALPRTCPSPVLPVSPQRRARRQRSAAGALPRWLQRWTATSPVSPQSGADTPGQVSTPAASTEVATAQKDEAAGYKKRAEESAADGVVAQRPPRGGDAPPPGSWSWTLNWDPVLLRPDGSPEVFVGSCPRCAADVDRLVDEAKVEAILCLQSDDCWTALAIDSAGVRAACARRGVLWMRVAVRDFDRLDQAAMLPDMVRMLNASTTLGKRTYVHCTAGINRASLTVVGLLTLARGWPLEEALAHVREARPQANPYVEPWRVARQRLLAGREEELYLLATKAGTTLAQGGDWIARDWGAAQRQLLMDQFARRAEADATLASSRAL